MGEADLIFRNRRSKLTLEKFNIHGFSILVEEMQLEPSCIIFHIQVYPGKKAIDIKIAKSIKSVDFGKTVVGAGLSYRGSFDGGRPIPRTA